MLGDKSSHDRLTFELIISQGHHVWNQSKTEIYHSLPMRIWSTKSLSPARYRQGSCQWILLRSRRQWQWVNFEFFDQTKGQEQIRGCYSIWKPYHPFAASCLPIRQLAMDNGYDSQTSIPLQGDCFLQNWDSAFCNRVLSRNLPTRIIPNIALYLATISTLHLKIDTNTFGIISSSWLP